MCCNFDATLEHCNILLLFDLRWFIKLQKCKQKRLDSDTVHAQTVYLPDAHIINITKLLLRIRARGSVVLPEDQKQSNGNACFQQGSKTEYSTKNDSNEQARLFSLTSRAFMGRACVLFGTRNQNYSNFLHSSLSLFCI